MVDRPILFSAPMVRAILAGTKTQTRRIVKPQPFSNNSYHDGDIQLAGYPPRSTGCPVLASFSVGAVGGGGGLIETAECPYGEPGDRLWVRETFGVYATGMDDITLTWPASPERSRDMGPYQVPNESLVGYFKLVDRSKSKRNPRSGLSSRITVPSIHMPRWASRITLAVTGVRVERLTDISEDDAKAEGLKAISKDGTLVKYGIPDRDGLPGNDDDGWHWQEWERDPRQAFRRLWESINGPGSWDANPWVWVVEFRRVEVAHG